MTGEGKRCALYVRVSKKEQDPRMQFAALRDLARLRGWRIVAVYRERRSSVLDRPQWRRCMHEASMRRFDVLAVWALDRVGRKLLEVVANVEKLQERGVGLVSLRDGAIDTTQASGRMILAVMAACAQFERERIVERTVEALNAKRRRGERLGRPRLAFDLAAGARRIAAGEPLAAVARSIVLERKRGPARPLSSRSLRRLLVETYGSAKPGALSRAFEGNA